MWKNIKPFVGVLLIFASLNGLQVWISGDKPMGRDLEAIGMIVSLQENKLRVTRFATKTDHYITYSFPAIDGQTYSKHFSITPEEFASLRKGQRVRVRYNSNNPSINAIAGFRHYSTVKDVDKFSPRHYPIVHAAFLAGTFLLGAYFVCSSFGGRRPSVPAVRPTSGFDRQLRSTTAKIPANRLAAARTGRVPRANGA